MAKLVADLREAFATIHPGVPVFDAMAEALPFEDAALCDTCCAPSLN